MFLVHCSKSEYTQIICKEIYLELWNNCSDTVKRLFPFRLIAMKQSQNEKSYKKSKVSKVHCVPDLI